MISRKPAFPANTAFRWRDGPATFLNDAEQA